MRYGAAISHYPSLVILAILQLNLKRQPAPPRLLYLDLISYIGRWCSAPSARSKSKSTLLLSGWRRAMAVNRETTPPPPLSLSLFAPLKPERGHRQDPQLSSGVRTTTREKDLRGSIALRHNAADPDRAPHSSMRAILLLLLLLPLVPMRPCPTSFSYAWRCSTRPPHHKEWCGRGLASYLARHEGPGIGTVVGAHEIRHLALRFSGTTNLSRLPPLYFRSFRRRDLLALTFFCSCSIP